MEGLCQQFSLADLRKSTNNFDENRITGTSIYSVLYKGYLEHIGATDYTMAIKRMKSKSDQGKFQNEIELLCHLRHPNLVSLIGFCDHKDENILVYEYMSNGSLYDRLLYRDTELLSWNKRLEICIGAAKGLHYLHTGAKRTIFHRDIKPQNILSDDNMVPKLSHLGFSLLGPLFKSKPKPIQVDSIIGTLRYMAPEYVMTSTFTDKCDVYSFGMVLLEAACTNITTTLLEDLDLYSGHLRNREEFLQKLLADEIIDPILTEQISPECLAVFMDITKRCLKTDPNERPIMGEVEVELEQALTLQEEADARKTGGDYK